MSESFFGARNASRAAAGLALLYVAYDLGIAEGTEYGWLALVPYIALIAATLRLRRTEGSRDPATGVISVLPLVWAVFVLYGFATEAFSGSFGLSLRIAGVPLSFFLEGLAGAFVAMVLVGPVVSLIYPKRSVLMALLVILPTVLFILPTSLQGYENPGAVVGVLVFDAVALVALGALVTWLATKALNAAFGRLEGLPGPR